MYWILFDALKILVRIRVLIVTPAILVFKKLYHKFISVFIKTSTNLTADVTNVIIDKSGNKAKLCNLDLCNNYPNHVALSIIILTMTVLRLMQIYFNMKPVIKNKSILNTSACRSFHFNESIFNAFIQVLIPSSFFLMYGKCFNFPTL